MEVVEADADGNGDTHAAHDALAVAQRGDDIDPARLGRPSTIGITAGASAPEILVDEVIAKLRQLFTVSLEAMTGEENVSFKLPPLLVNKAATTAERPA